MGDIKHFIKYKLIEGLLGETHTGQKDLQKLTGEILKLLSSTILKEKSHMTFLTNNKEEPIMSLPKTNTLMMTGDEYNEIGEFVEATNIIIKPTRLINGKESVRGELGYSPPDDFGNDLLEIKLKYNQDDLSEINNKLNNDNVTINDIYVTLYYIFHTVLLHELQHAYDAWRSNGKAFNTQLSKDYINKKIKASKVISSKVDMDDLTPEEIEAINNSSIAYLNLTHEINARYAQAIDKIRLTGLDWDTFDDIKKNWVEVYKDFIKQFYGWSHLSDKMKKKLTRRLAKAYQEETEKLSTNKTKTTNSELVKENSTINDFKTWKRKNVTLRGVKNLGKDNGVSGYIGRGLYTVPLSNKSMAKEYGKLYFVVNGNPKNPKIFNTLNEWEIWFQNNLVFNISKANGKDYPDIRDFNNKTTIEKELLNLGYDGVIIKGREIVNYKPSDVLYFEDEGKLYNYYLNNI